MKNLTKFLFLASFLFVLSCNSAPQKKDTANASSLKSESLHPLRNGFSIFELGSPIKNYSKSVKLVEESYHKQSYEVIDPNLLNIKEGLKVDTIIIDTWDGYIDYIKVIVSGPYKEKFRDMLIGAYGMGHNKTNNSTYGWYFKDPRLLVIYRLNSPTEEASASFARSIGKTEPSKELIEQAKSNINEI